MAGCTRRDAIQKATALGLGAVAAEKFSLFASRASGRLGPNTGSVNFFPRFKQLKTPTSGAVINYVVGGNGPGLLLLHGYPQTHIIWRKIAPQLSEKFTTVIPDLRDYGDSSKPADGQNHFAYSKRAMAQDQVELMGSLGFKSFVVVGHDRGGRVAHRLALDHAEAIARVAVLDIVPTYKVFHSVNKEVAAAFYHWFFLIQPAPFPETLIGNNAEFFLKTMMLSKVAAGTMEEEAFAEYLRCFRDPASIHATCEDYRAAASIDLDHDAADLDRKISCPLLALWSEQGRINRLFDVLDAWRERASQVSGRALPGWHYLPEEAPQAVLQELTKFL